MSTSEPPAIAAESLEVRYTTTLDVRPTLQARVRALGRADRSERLTVEALRGVSLVVPAGQALGIVGGNGAGKSTLLRVVAGIVPPSAGTVAVTGRITAVLKPGAAFNPRLSGRQNLLLGGLAAGLVPDEIAAREHAIVAFADVGRLIDAPLRAWSSGMVQRLAFAIAVHLDPQILLLDEGLSAGDEAFRRRSAERMRALVGSSAPVVMVSHNQTQLAELADRVVWLDAGRVRADGPADSVLRDYRAASSR